MPRPAAASGRRSARPRDQVGSVNDPRTREEYGVRWNEKWIYRGADGDGSRPHRALEPLRPVGRLPAAATDGFEPEPALAGREPGAAGVAGPRAEAGPPPLRPFGLVLHHDGRWSHEGEPILHRRLRAAFDRCVRYLPDERKYVVQLGRFRGEIEVEEAAFFVREVDLPTGELRLSDGGCERLDPATLHVSPRDGAWLCRVKPDLEPGGLLARFSHAAQADLLLGVEDGSGGPGLRVGRVWQRLPDLGGR